MTTQRNAVVVEHEGEPVQVTVLARRVGMAPSTLFGRLRRGIPLAEALDPRSRRRGPRQCGGPRADDDGRYDGLTPEEVAALRERYPVVPDLPFERDAAAQRFVEDHERGASLAEVGALLGVSRERVRQIEQAALATLRRRRSCLEQLWRESEAPGGWVWPETVE